MEPGENLAASEDASRMLVAVEPDCGVTAADGSAPSAAGAAPLAGASRFMCCDAVARAIVSLVQLRNSKLTCAPRVSRTCSSGAAGMPVDSGAVLLAGLRAKFWIHPRLIHGAGGASRLKRPCSEGSKSAGVCAVRFTGAKYARTLRVTGAGAEKYVDAIYSPCSW